MNIRRKYRCFVCCLLVSGICLLGFAVWHLLCSQIPDMMTVSGYGEIPELFSEPVAQWISGEVAKEKPDRKTTEVKMDHGSHSEETGWKRSDAKTAKKPETGNDRTQAEQEKQIVKNGKTGATVIEAAAGEAASDGYAKMQSAENDSYEIEYTLFGKIPLKTVQACVAAPKMVYAGGTPIGMYLRTSGVLVVGTDAIHTKSGELCCPAGSVLQAGDYIKSADGKTLTTKEELIDCLGKSDGKSVQLQVERGGERMTCSVAPVLDESGAYRAGVWVRNDTQGIGTLTYVDEDGHFGALGHGISDIDTGTILAIDGGTLYDADVVSVVRGQEGAPGELAGVIHYSEGYKIGVIEANNPNGIYGTISGFSLLADQMEQYEVAYRQSVTTGPAQILCTTGDHCEVYDVELKEVRRTGGDVNKGIILEVTDEALLAKTGGIVQGMSGSPIIQDGKLIGAVTHVFVNDPKKGYGIFIEDML